MQKHDVTDESIILSIQSGDKTAFKMLFERYYKVLLITAINLLKDKDVAKDIVQDVFLKIWNKRASIEVKGAPIAYLKRAVINQSLNKINAQKRFTSDEQLILEPSKEASSDQYLAAEDLKQEMDKALDTLPQGCRTIFVMRRLEGMKVKEIAEQLNISPKTVENQLTKALKVLKNAIQPYVTKNSS